MPVGMERLLIFGLGYTASRFADPMRTQGFAVDATGSAGNLDFSDMEAVNDAIGRATHILSSVPPDRATGSDPVIDTYGRALATAPARWVGYLSSTGVYGDAGGAWVDEATPIGGGRRNARMAADVEWQSLSKKVRVFRLPGIYGPGRSALDKVCAGKAHRIDLPGQIFSRVHVDDIVGGLLASLGGPPGIYNLADDPGESNNLAADHPDVVAELMVYIEQARADLGDTGTNNPGTGRRPAGRRDLP